MNREDIIRMAREAGAAMIHGGEHALMGDFALETFFQKAYNAGTTAEREECAKTVEQCDWPKWAERVDEREVFAAAIRARGQQ